MLARHAALALGFSGFLAGCVVTPGASVTASSGSIYRAFNSMRVVPVADRAESFVVLSQALAGPADHWCAAGDYAQRRLGARATDRVYIVQGSAPTRAATGRRGVTFTTAPGPDLAGGRRPGEGGSVSLSLSEPGFNLSRAMAWGYCTDSRRRLTGAGGRRF